MHLVRQLSGGWQRLCRDLADRLYLDTDTGSHQAVVNRLAVRSTSWLLYIHWPTDARRPTA